MWKNPKEAVLEAVPVEPDVISVAGIRKKINISRYIHTLLSQLIAEGKIQKRPPTRDERRIGRSMDFRLKVVYYRPRGEDGSTRGQSIISAPPR